MRPPLSVRPFRRLQTDHNEAEEPMAFDDTTPAIDILRAMDEALMGLYKQGTNVSSADGIDFLAVHGVRLARYCGCGSELVWGELLPDGSWTCPEEPKASMGAFHWVTMVLAVLAVWAPGVLVLLHRSSRSGALLLFGAMLQLAAMVGTGGLLYELAIEWICENEGYAIACGCALGVGALSNLMLCNNVIEKLRELDEEYWKEQWQLALPLMFLLGPSGVGWMEVLVSDIGGLDLFGLLRGKQSERETYLQAAQCQHWPSLLLSHGGHLAVQVWFLFEGVIESGQDMNLTLGLAIGLTGGCIVWRLVMSVVDIGVPEVVHGHRRAAAGPAGHGRAEKARSVAAARAEGV